jgi:DNA adenine methylase
MSRFRTPLRYPGGKQKIAPFIREILNANKLIGGTYIEPYAGGAGVAMELLLDDHVEQVLLNDLNPAIFAFWRSVLNQTEELCRRVSRVVLTIDEWRRQQAIYRAPRSHSQIDVAFAALYLNRCNRSGIFSAGVIGGLEQRGEWKMDARFPVDDLIGRIQRIALRRRRISVSNLDAETFLLEHVNRVEGPSLTYCDPPYFNKADRLYTNFYRAPDHARIADLIQSKVRSPWVVSYDNAPEISRCYWKRRSFVYNLQYTASSAYVGREVFFFADRLAIPRESAVKNIDEALKAAQQYELKGPRSDLEGRQI